MNHLDVYFLNSVREFGKGGVQMAISDFTLSALSLSQVSPTTIMSFFSCSIGCLNNVFGVSAGADGKKHITIPTDTFNISGVNIIK